MLFHPAKNPVELRVIHLNKNQEQRREDLMEATQGKAALKQFRKTMAKMVISKQPRLSICAKKSVR